MCASGNSDRHFERRQIPAAAIRGRTAAGAGRKAVPVRGFANRLEGRRRRGRNGLIRPLRGGKFRPQQSAAERPPALVEKPFRFGDLQTVLKVVAGEAETV